MHKAYITEWCVGVCVGMQWLSVVITRLECDHVLAKLHDEKSVQTVAVTLLCFTTMVRYWFDPWLEHGGSGLETSLQFGCPIQLAPVDWEVIEKALDTHSSNNLMANWNTYYMPGVKLPIDSGHP